MLHAGLDLSRKKIDVCLLSAAGEVVDEWASPPDSDGLRGLAARAVMWGGSVRGGIESMNGARFVHDRLEEHGWEVLIADAAKVKGLAPLACKTDKIDARVLATLSARDLVPKIWLPDPSVRRERELARFRLHLVRHRTIDDTGNGACPSLIARCFAISSFSSPSLSPAPACAPSYAAAWTVFSQQAWRTPRLANCPTAQEPHSEPWRRPDSASGYIASASVSP